jgi:MoxR-like ATPase
VPRTDERSVVGLSNPGPFDSIEDVAGRFASVGYVADRLLATTVFLAARLSKPLLLEGEPGVGKTEVAKVLARVLCTDLIRLQCYEGLDAQASLYEWNYPRQLLQIRLEEARGVDRNAIGSDIFGEAFLLKRPLLDAISGHRTRAPVLLIDEVDRSEEEFEAFLLELLSDFQVSVPELGTVRAVHRPFVILTSNRTRELHDALKRRCLYHWIDYPSFDKEMRIVRTHVPEIDGTFAAQICRFMESLRELDLVKRPGVAETIDWVRALAAIGVAELDVAAVNATIGCVLKSHADLQGARALDIGQRVSDACRAASLSGEVSTHSTA